MAQPAAAKKAQRRSSHRPVVVTHGGKSALPQTGVTLRQGVKLLDLSPVVRRHVENLVGSGRLGTIMKVVKNGRLTYQVAFNRDGKHRDVTLDGSGKVAK